MAIKIGEDILLNPIFSNFGKDSVIERMIGFNRYCEVLEIGVKSVLSHRCL